LIDSAPLRPYRVVEAETIEVVGTIQDYIVVRFGILVVAVAGQTDVVVPKTAVGETDIAVQMTIVA
jgi:hypothetical protein